MSSRRNRPPNRWGCMPEGDVCLQHCLPLMCRHGCKHVDQHKCKDQEQRAVETRHSFEADHS